jgi:methyl-accepting chemotaxis protein
MDQVTQSTASNAEESAAAAEELNAQSAELKQIVGDLSALVGSINQKSVHAAEASSTADENFSHAHPKAKVTNSIPRKKSLTSANKM